jgi:aminopeptidase N
VRRSLIFLLTALALSLASGSPVGGQSSKAVLAFHATHYDVDATLHPADQSISARAKIEFTATTGTRDLVVELHEDLHVSSVKNEKGQSIPSERDAINPLYLHVSLPEAVTTGKQVTLTFDYSGPIGNDEDSPTKGLRFASVDKAWAYLLLPARWFPLTGYTSNTYTAVFKLIVPESFVVVGTGKSDAPTPLPGSEPGGGKQVSYTFRCDKPGRAGSFVAGPLQLSPAKVEGEEVRVFTPVAQANTAEAYASEAVHISTYFADQFGALKDPELTIAQMPAGSVAGFSAPGLVLISAGRWTAKPETGIMAQLIAGQWWGNSVVAASPADVWVTDGLARYSQGMYVEQDAGNTGLHHDLEDFAVGALMYESDSPISQSQRLQSYSDAYRSVVIDKGAIVFHMLRTQLGDEAFHDLLKEFYEKYEGKPATIGEFKQLALAKAPAPVAGKPRVNLNSFFSQWLDSTGIPEFKTEYIVYRVRKGFRVVGKIRQDLETFQMPVEVKIDTEGNPEFKTVAVTGTTSAFDLETFGRPKANGVTLDPNNNILKSSPKLRTRASVARGEGLAADGKYYEAIQEYQRALDVQPTNSLAHFREGEAMFYQKNNQAAANAFRSAIDGDLDPKWIEVWSHIYLGKIFDLTGQRDRAVNEYQRAQNLRDDTAGAQTEVTALMQRPFSLEPQPPAAAGATPAATPAAPPQQQSQPDDSPNAPKLKRPTN